MKITRQLLLIPMFLNIIHADLFAQNKETIMHTLNATMKSFNDRINLYFECLRGNCTPQDRQYASKAIIKDGLILLGLLVTFGTATGLTIKYGLPKLQKYNDQKITQEFKKAGNASAQAQAEYQQALDEWQSLPKDSPQAAIAAQKVRIAEAKKQKAIIRDTKAIKQMNKLLDKNIGGDI